MIKLYYDLELFGEKLKNIRKNLKLSQKDLAEQTFVAERTIRRYESGKVMPSFDMLETMSAYYKTDLAALLIDCRFDDYSVFNSLKNKLDLRFYNKSDQELNKELDELDILLSTAKNQYCINLIIQLKIFIEAIELYNNNNFDLAYERFIESMKITTPKFNMDKYHLFILSSMEIRILMNISLIVNKRSDKSKYLEILEFCINNIELTDTIFPILCTNLAGAYIRINNYEKSLHYSNIGINYCIDNQNTTLLSNLYYTKGFSEFRLNNEKYIDTLRISLYLCKAYKQEKLYKIIVERCKEFSGINLC